MPKNKNRKKGTVDKPRTLFRGKFSATRSGAGFVSPSDGSEDVFIPSRARHGAIDGDEVNFLLVGGRSRPAGGKRTGRIAGILVRPRTVLMAQLQGKRSARPMNPHLPEELRICGTLPENACEGDWVRVKLLGSEEKPAANLHAEVLACCGKTGNPEDDLAAIAAEYQLEEPYTQSQEAAAARIKARKIERADLRDFFTFTIDPADAHDFDDAISISPGEKDAELLLGVHIADAAAFIPPGSTADREACKRGFSAYIPGLYLPMLPRTLVSRICLREGIDSPAHSILFTVRKKDGKILSAERMHSTVRVDKRLDYAGVQQGLGRRKNPPETWTPELFQYIKEFASIVRKMRSRRKKKEQFLDMAMPETRAVYDGVQKKVVSIEYKKPCEADSLVEECMLAANSFVARELLEREIPALFRIHPEPDPEKIAFFENLCRDSFRFSPGDILASRSAALHFLETIPPDHRKPVILSLFLRSLPRASYQAEPGLHYGLGKEKYTHFTSPVRRYPDLLVHQQLWNADKNGALKSRKILEELAEKCSLQEENTDNAFFAANDRLKLHFLKEHNAFPGNTTLYEAVISKVNASGLLCNIEELGIYGFVPREKLRGGFYRRLPGGRQKMTSGQGRTRYRIGDFIYLVLDSVDLVRGGAVFRPAI